MSNYTKTSVLYQDEFITTSKCIDASNNEFILSEYAPTVPPYSDRNSVEYETARQSFINEYTIISQSQNAKELLSINSIYSDNGLLYVFSNVIHGQPLPDYLAANGIMSPVQMKNIFGSLIKGIDFASKSGIMFTSYDESSILIADNSAIVLSFGRRFSVEPNSYLNLLGELIYYVLTGKKYRETVKLASEFNPAVTPDLDRVLIKTITSTPALNYKTIFEFYESMATAIDMPAAQTIAPITAAPETNYVTHTEVPKKKKSGKAALIAILAILLSGGLIFGGYVAYDYFNGNTLGFFDNSSVDDSNEEEDKEEEEEDEKEKEEKSKEADKSEPVESEKNSSDILDSEDEQETELASESNIIDEVVPSESLQEGINLPGFEYDANITDLLADVYVSKDNWDSHVILEGAVYESNGIVYASQRGLDGKWSLCSIDPQSGKATKLLSNCSPAFIQEANGIIYYIDCEKEYKLYMLQGSSYSMISDAVNSHCIYDNTTNLLFYINQTEGGQIMSFNPETYVVTTYALYASDMEYCDNMLFYIDKYTQNIYMFDAQDPNGTNTLVDEYTSVDLSEYNGELYYLDSLEFATYKYSNYDETISFINEANAYRFDIYDEVLYYIDNDTFDLMKSNLDGSNAVSIIQEDLAWFTIFAGKIYYYSDKIETQHGYVKIADLYGNIEFIISNQ